MAEDDVVEAKQIDPRDDGQRPPPVKEEHILELLRHFMPYIIGGTAAEAGAWAKFYGLMPQHYRMVVDVSGLNGMQVNRDFVVLVGSYRQERPWEMNEAIQYVQQVGVRVVHGGQYE